MSDYSGKIEYKAKSLRYSFSEEEHQLEITSAEDKIVKQWYNKHQGIWTRLKSFDCPELIIKIGQEIPSYRRGTYTYSIDDCFVFWNFGDSKNEVHRITYCSDILDSFYRPKNHMLNISRALNAFSSKERKHFPRVRTHSLKFGDKEIRFLFCEMVERRPYEAKDIVIYNILRVESESALTYDEVVRINTIVERFLSFVACSRSININTIRINDYGLLECSDYACGHCMIGAPSERAIGGVVLDYAHISSKLNEIFELIYNDDICFISLFQYEADKISPVDIMNICAAFEYH